MKALELRGKALNELLAMRQITDLEVRPARKMAVPFTPEFCFRMNDGTCVTEIIRTDDNAAEVRNIAALWPLHMEGELRILRQWKGSIKVLRTVNGMEGQHG